MAGNSWIREKAATSLNPSQVETSLVQLSERWPANMLPLARVLEQFPLGEPALMHLLAVSSICATRLTQDPDILLWLCQPEVCLASRGYAEMAGDLRVLAGDSIAKQDFAALRFWKGREMTRVAVRELANVAPLEETTGELSQIAEICIRRVLEHWDTEFRKRHGSPTAEFVILALGKLGGGELNHSWMLIFFFSTAKKASSHRAFPITSSSTGWETKSWKHFPHIIQKAHCFVLICAFVRKVLPGRSPGHSRAWKIITLVSVKLGNAWL